VKGEGRRAKSNAAIEVADQVRTVLIMAGGTGGHVFPALAVAHYLAEQGFRIVWLGTRTGLEANLVPPRGYDIEWIKFSGVRGKGILRWALLPLALLLACYQSVRVIFRRRPDVVLGMGGFAAFPGGLMASLLNRPLVLHEQNSVVGLSNRVLAAVADRVLTGFPNPFGASDSSRPDAVDPARPARKLLTHTISSFIPHPSAFEFVGNPVRREIAKLAAPSERYAQRQGRLRLLVVGGSLGAQALNRAVPSALKLIPQTQRPQVTHQSGANHYDALQKTYAEAGVAGDLKTFIDDMASAYADCDLVICRAGALTIAELCTAGVASVLIPFPYAVDDHQTGNAYYLSAVGAAVLVSESELSAQRLAQLINGFTRDQLLQMAEKARSLAKPQATETVARACMELAHAA